MAGFSVFAALAVLLSLSASALAMMPYSCKLSKNVTDSMVKTRGSINFDMDGMGMVNIKKVKNFTTAHIHKAPAGTAGPPVVFLIPSGLAPLTGDFSFPLIFNMTLLDKATLTSGGYYFNVHTTKYPAGEVRCTIMAN